MRATPFVSRPSESWVRNSEALSNTTLFMVARVGPTVFTLKDENDGTFRVTLGNPHTCTCGAAEDCCIHKLFCLIKVLRVPMTHSLCFQSSLTDSELDQVLDGIITATNRRPVRQRPVRAVPVVSGEVAKETVVQRQPLVDGEDNSCTICMDDMTVDQALTWCRVGCGQNLHAKCMMKCAQHNITNRLPITCPLCRNLMDLDTLKQDCKGKASLKQTYAPVQCASCKCHQRGTFYRCVECSQMACLGAGKPVDFCPECFERQQDPVHRVHHFVRSDIVTEASHGLEWTPCKNPALRGVITDPRLVHDLQSRELGVEDYDLLLQLSSGGPAQDLPTLCVESLPAHKRPKKNKDNTLKLQCWCTNARHSPARIRSSIQVTSPVTGEAVMSPSRPSATGGDSGSPVNSPSHAEQRAMRVLPCRHVAHDRCLREEVALLTEHDSGKVAEYRCSHIDCGKRIFIGLSRKRRSRKAADAASAAAAAAEANAAALLAAGAAAMSGIVGARCFGPDAGVAAPADPMASSSVRTVRGLLHRRNNSVGSSASDLSSGVGSATMELGVSGSAAGAMAVGGYLGAHRVVNRAVQLARQHSETSEQGSGGLAGFAGVGFVGNTGGHATSVMPRRPPAGQRVRLRALGDAAGAPAAASAAVGGGRRQSTTALEAGVLGLGQRRDGDSLELLSSLSDRAPSPAPRLMPPTHQRALSIGSRGLEIGSGGSGLGTGLALGSGRSQQSATGRVSDVLVFNLSQESRQRQRERNRPPPPAFDPTLMVASVSLSNPAIGGATINLAAGGSVSAVNASSAGYPLHRPTNDEGADVGLGIGGGAAGGRAGAGRRPGGRIVRGLNRGAVPQAEAGPLPTLG